MSLFSIMFSIFHALLLLLIPIFTFLWIIGKLKAVREENISYQYQQSFPQTQPSPSNVPLQPRRLSFSSAVTTNTPTTPTHITTPKRRVTFSLTPEQQANELLKTAVRHRGALPSLNHLIQNQPSPQRYQPQEQVAHLFPSRNHISVHDSPSPPTLPPVIHQPIPIEKPLPKPSSPNYHYNPLPKRYRSPRKPLPRPTSPPPYVTNLAPPSPRTAIPQTFNYQSLNHPGNNSSVPRSDIRVLSLNLPAHAHRGAPYGDNKPPKAPGFNNIPNGFVQRSVR